MLSLIHPLFALLILLAGFALLYWVFDQDDKEIPEDDPRFDYFYDEHR